MYDTPQLSLKFKQDKLRAAKELDLMMENQWLQCRVLSPLRLIPGPFLASITDFWLIFTDLAGKRTITIHELHQKHGPAVRIGPNEVSFSSPSVINRVYTQQTPFMKAPAYKFMSVEPVGIFSQTDKAKHTQRRNLLSHAFSQQSLENCLPLVQEKIDLLLATVERHKTKPLDMLLRFRLLALDIVGELFLGQSFGALQADETPQFLHDTDLHFIQCGIQGNLPWIHALLTILPVPSIQHFLGASERIAQFGNTAYKDYLRKHGRDSGRRDLLTKILKPSGEGVSMTDREIYVEIANMVFAGTDTTSTTLTYMFWELTQHPSWQTQIRAELKETLEDPREAFSKPLPILEAVINESLRLHPSAPASLVRVVPPGGTELEGHHLPAATVVSAQCYTTHRNAEAFSEPDEFRPSRWLTDSMSDQAKSLFMPFSRGTRACLGKTLAMFELKSTAAALLMKYSVRAAEETSEESMAMVDHFLMIPKAGKCDLVFTHV